MGQGAALKRVVLYAREECCLCDQARKALDAVQARHPKVFSLREIDIESDERLHRAYLERIPVVSIDGEDVFEFFVDEAELEHRLGIVGVE